MRASNFERRQFGFYPSLEKIIKGMRNFVGGITTNSRQALIFPLVGFYTLGGLHTYLSPTLDSHFFYTVPSPVVEKSYSSRFHDFSRDSSLFRLVEETCRDGTYVHIRSLGNSLYSK